MGEIEVSVSFNPFECIESILRAYSAQKLTQMEEIKVQAQLEGFKEWLHSQKDDNQNCREQMVREMETYRELMTKIMDACLLKPEIMQIFAEQFKEMLEKHSFLAAKLSETRIGSR